MLEEGVGDHRHERVTVKAWPRSSLEVIETEFFFHLLMGLFADPSRLDGGSQRAQFGAGRLTRAVRRRARLYRRADAAGLCP